MRLLTVPGIYKYFDVTGEDLWQDMHPGEHAFANNKAHELFGKYL